MPREFTRTSLAGIPGVPSVRMPEVRGVVERNGIGSGRAPVTGLDERGSGTVGNTDLLAVVPKNQHEVAVSATGVFSKSHVPDADTTTMHATPPIILTGKETVLVAASVGDGDSQNGSVGDHGGSQENQAGIADNADAGGPRRPGWRIESTGDDEPERNIVELEDRIRRGESIEEYQINTIPIPQTPEEVVPDLEGLERHRFSITQASLEGIQNIAQTTEEIKADIPYVQGVGFFGSRTKGTEHQLSDFDIYIFYDSSKYTNDFPGSEREWEAITRHIQDRLGQRGRLDSKIKRRSSEQQVDISKLSTDIDLDNLKKFASNYLQDTSKAPPHVLEIHSVVNLMARFLLCTGDDVIKNRKYILDSLAEDPNGDAYFRFLMRSLANFERHAKAKVVIPQYGDLPQTIEEGREYFLRQQQKEQ